MIASFDVTNIRLETERLILRPWQETDIEDLYDYARVDGVGQMAGWLPHQSLQESKSILNSFCKERKTFALEYKETGRVIGSIGLEDRDFPEAGNLCGRGIGYVLSKDHWGKGLMPEAVNAVVAFCFQKLDFDWLTCAHFSWNHQSNRVIEKCGFQYIKDENHRTHYHIEELSRLYVQFNPYKER